MANCKVRSQAVVETGRGSEAVSDLHMRECKFNHVLQTYSLGLQSHKRVQVTDALALQAKKRARNVRSLARTSSVAAKLLILSTKSLILLIKRQQPMFQEVCV